VSGEAVFDGGNEVIKEPKSKRRQPDHARASRERTLQENALDEALKNTFPASDPVSAEQPVSPGADRDGARSGGFGRWSESARKFGVRRTRIGRVAPHGFWKGRAVFLALLGGGGGFGY
jgi:hypothetical protein